MRKFLLMTALMGTAGAMAQVPGEAVNLSAEETANCYIVAPGTVAYFDATHKGNSLTEMTGDVTGARLVWQSAQSLVTRIEFDAESGSICAWTSGIPGNALVAATDAEGKILWSWHLWVTDYDPANDFTTEANSAGTTWTFMDRNLGAVSTERGAFDNFGMLYQWGRKDPFPGAASFTVMNEDYTYAVDGEPTLYDIDNNVVPKVSSKAGNQGTMALSIENPDVFYTAGDYPTGDWIDVSDDDYWGGESMEKTIYDPSPAGYKVPVCYAGGNTPYDWLKYASMTWDTEHNGAEQNGQWFPATGTRVYASGSLDYPEGGNPYSGLWIGTKGKASANPEENPELYGQYMFIINGKRTFKVSKDKRSQGLSLRCVRDNSSPSNMISDISVRDTDSLAPVYNLQGMMVLKNATSADIRSLDAGIYIYKSRKIKIRR